MDNESGFSLTEVITALFILSLGAVALSQSVGTMITSWDRTKNRTSSVDHLTDLALSIEPFETHQRAETGIPDGPVLSIEDGPALQLSSPRLDRGADCEFDMVGRRCR